MIPDRPQPLLEILLREGLVAPTAAPEATQLAAASPDARALCTRLGQRGHLTAFQVRHLLQGQIKGLLLRDYVLLDLLGEGGMGVVYKARHRLLNRVVALKVIRPGNLDSAQAVKRFEREALAAAQVDHPNVVRASDAGKSEEGHFYAMEYVEGTDLARLVEEEGPLPVARACLFARQTALGLEHIRQRGLVHRDIKPQNLIALDKPEPGREVMILDLGLAILRAPEADGGKTLLRLTRIGATMGTPDFMAPEQTTDSHAVDIRADIYSLGCTLFFLLTGQPPFAGGSIAQRLFQHRELPAPEVSKLRPDVPVELTRVLQRFMAKKPEERYATPAQAAEALLPFCGVREERVQANPPPRPKKPDTLRPPRKSPAKTLIARTEARKTAVQERGNAWKGWLAGGAAAAGLLLGLILYFTLSGPEDAEPEPITKGGANPAIPGGQPEKEDPRKTKPLVIALTDKTEKGPEKKDPDPEVVPETKKDDPETGKKDDGPKKEVLPPKGEEPTTTDPLPTDKGTEDKKDLSPKDGPSKDGPSDKEPVKKVPEEKVPRKPEDPAPPLVAGSFVHRVGPERDWLLRTKGGTKETEAAIAAGLDFLLRMQKADGSWAMDDQRYPEKQRGISNNIAGTAFALLPLLAAGKIHRQPPGPAPKVDNPDAEKKFAAAVSKGVQFLIRKQEKNGKLDGNMYAHAIATIALCEAYGLSKDVLLRKNAQAAVNFIVFAQHEAGGWRYAPNQPGDTSVCGWMVSALTAADLAGLKVPDLTLKKAHRFLDSVVNLDDEGYGYTGPATTFTLTAVGLHCRQHLQGWGPDHPRLQKALVHLRRVPPTAGQIYYTYYATQVLYHHGGKDWEDWNGKMQAALLADQDQAPGLLQGSFKGAKGHTSGRLMQTSLCLCALQVYYRYAPLFGPAKP